MPRQYTKRPAAERFWPRVDTSGGPDACWPWLGGSHGFGYGHFWINGRTTLAHRVAWELTRGPVPAGLCVLHDCPDGDNPACCNPAHLWLGDKGVNNTDRAVKGRSATGARNGGRTHPERVPRGERNGRVKLSDEQVVDIRVRYVRGGPAGRPPGNSTALSVEYGVDVSTIRRIATGRVR
jgi:hypothetical protein